MGIAINFAIACTLVMQTSFPGVWNTCVHKWSYMVHSHILKYSHHIRSLVGQSERRILSPLQRFLFSKKPWNPVAHVSAWETRLFLHKSWKKIAFYINCGLVFLNAFNQDRKHPGFKLWWLQLLSLWADQITGDGMVFWQVSFAFTSLITRTQKSLKQTQFSMSLVV